MPTKKNVLSWLQSHPVAVLASVSADHKPQMAAVHTYVSSNFHCYFVTKVITRKAINLSKNGAVSVLWYDEKELITCEMSGEAYVVHSGEEVASAITHLQEIMTAKKTGYWTPPVGQLKGTQYVIFRVGPDEVNYVDYSSATKRGSEPEKFTFRP